MTNRRTAAARICTAVTGTMLTLAACWHPLISTFALKPQRPQPGGQALMRFSRPDLPGGIRDLRCLGVDLYGHWRTLGPGNGTVVHMWPYTFSSKQIAGFG